MNWCACDCIYFYILEAIFLCVSVVILKKKRKKIENTPPPQKKVFLEIVCELSIQVRCQRMSFLSTDAS